MKNILSFLLMQLFFLPPSEHFGLPTSDIGRYSDTIQPTSQIRYPKSEKPRTIVTTDGELDDVDSFIRMLLYANEYNVEGLIISSSQWHYKGDGKGTKFISEMEMTKNLYGERTELRWPGEQWIYDLVDAYTKVYPNLKKHAEGYPTGEHLRSLIRIGNIDFEGDMEKIFFNAAGVLTVLNLFFSCFVRYFPSMPNASEVCSVSLVPARATNFFAS